MSSSQCTRITRLRCMIKGTRWKWWECLNSSSEHRELARNFEGILTLFEIWRLVIRNPDFRNKGVQIEKLPPLLTSSGLKISQRCYSLHPNGDPTHARKWLASLGIFPPSRNGRCLGVLRTTTTTHRIGSHSSAGRPIPNQRKRLQIAKISVVRPRSC